MNYLEKLRNVILRNISALPLSGESSTRLATELSTTFLTPIISVDEAYGGFLDRVKDSSDLTDAWLQLKISVLTNLGEELDITKATFTRMLVSVVGSEDHTQTFLSSMELGDPSSEGIESDSYFIFCALRIYGWHIGQVYDEELGE